MQRRMHGILLQSMLPQYQRSSMDTVEVVDNIEQKAQELMHWAGMHMDDTPASFFRVYITFFQGFSSSLFSSRVFLSGSYNYLGAATDSLCHVPAHMLPSPYQLMTFQSLPPQGSHLETASAITDTFFFLFCVSQFLISSSDYGEFVEQPDGTRLRPPRRVTSNGGAVWVRSHEQISVTSPALVSGKKIKKGQEAPAPYVPDKKWKVIRRFWHLKYRKTRSRNIESTISNSMRALGWTRAASKCCCGIY